MNQKNNYQILQEAEKKHKLTLSGLLSSSIGLINCPILCARHYVNVGDKDINRHIWSLLSRSFYSNWWKQEKKKNPYISKFIIINCDKCYQGEV